MACSTRAGRRGACRDAARPMDVYSPSGPTDACAKLLRGNRPRVSALARNDSRTAWQRTRPRPEGRWPRSWTVGARLYGPPGRLGPLEPVGRHPEPECTDVRDVTGPCLPTDAASTSNGRVPGFVCALCSLLRLGPGTRTTGSVHVDGFVSRRRLRLVPCPARTNHVLAPWATAGGTPPSRPGNGRTYPG